MSNDNDNGLSVCDDVERLPEGSLDVSDHLGHLGLLIASRFQEAIGNDVGDLRQSIQPQREAADLALEGHLGLPVTLNSIGRELSLRFEKTGDINDLEKSIELTQEAMKLTPNGDPNLPSFLNNLGYLFSSRFGHTGNPADLSQSIRLRQQAVGLTLEGHPDLAALLIYLGFSFRSHFEETEELASLIGVLSDVHSSVSSAVGPPTVCLKAARRWVALSADISGSEVLNAHERIVNLISLVAALQITSKGQHEILRESSELSTAAAAAALAFHQPSKALEWLEEGRCIVWNQLNQLRTPVDNLQGLHFDLVNRLALLSNQLERMNVPNDHGQSAPSLPARAHISLQTEERIHPRLPKDPEYLLTSIQDMTSFRNFLRPRKHADLMKAIPDDGVIVVINSDMARCDALVLMAGRKEPLHVPIEKFTHERARILADGLREYLIFHDLRSRYSDEAVSNPRTLGIYKGPRAVDELRTILRTLWTDLLDPILEFLGFKNPGVGTDLPRVWWCPTGPFAFLPIHAAGIYDPEPGTTSVSLADYVVSSYIPNLGILDRLRSRKTNRPGNGVLLVSQPHTPNLPPIPKTKQETMAVCQELARRRIKATLYSDEDATVEHVLESMESYACIHLACHASQNIQNPLESAIFLHNGKVEISEIMKKDLPNADLAFLSACQTSAGDYNLPEEAVHIAAGMLTAGYRSVVATMWSISDKYAPEVADMFYQNLSDNDTAEGVAGLDVTGSARALHTAIQALRNGLDDKKETDLLTWIPYVHYGI
ncbi:hypothetical protein CVT26_005492 [Gymnopilus dilepis]|uniref:CHAT domain-containing protein n=1 Tax=Gymnopilus dilepis TaxID=231916 RepID=A0A409YT72_9AGAR|nr:hypothetical protein CVT26_005492 [Gymnopilus dilepis]